MSLPLPTSLSPSKVTSFKDCALAFRLSAIERLPEPPSPAATKGTLVHRALQLLMFEHDPGGRSRQAAGAALERATAEILDDATVAALDLDAAGHEAFVADASSLLDGYFALEDPDTVTVIGTELMLSVHVGGLHLRGIIDRLDVDAAGALVVTDYKTGRAPSVAYEQAKLGGVHFYALLCEEVLGVRPAQVRLLHLREPVAISTTPSELSTRGLRQQTAAVWSAVERACRDEDFRPNPGRACSWCGYHDYCPSMGGDLGRLVPGPAPVANVTGVATAAGVAAVPA